MIGKSFGCILVVFCLVFWLYSTCIFVVLMLYFFVFSMYLRCKEGDYFFCLQHGLLSQFFHFFPKQILSITYCMSLRAMVSQTNSQLKVPSLSVGNTLTSTLRRVIIFSNSIYLQHGLERLLTHFVDVSKLQKYPSKICIKLKAIGKQTNSQYAVPSLKVETWVIF